MLILNKITTFAIMKKSALKTKENALRIWRFISPIADLPLVYAGVVLLLIHYFLHSTSNVLLCLAIVFEVIGTVAHYAKIRH